MTAKNQSFMGTDWKVTVVRDLVPDDGVFYFTGLEFMETLTNFPMCDEARYDPEARLVYGDWLEDYGQDKHRADNHPPEASIALWMAKGPLLVELCAITSVVITDREMTDEAWFNWEFSHEWDRSMLPEIILRYLQRGWWRNYDDVDSDQVIWAERHFVEYSVDDIYADDDDEIFDLREHDIKELGHKDLNEACFRWALDKARQNNGSHLVC